MMRRQALLAGLALLLAGTSLAPARAADLNKPPKGFRALFNGKDLTNWKGLIEYPQRAKLDAAALQAAQVKADELMRAHWTVEDGVLIYDGKGQSLQTVKDYGDFEMYVDWRIQKAGDSGIYLRGQPQVQIWEPDSSSVAKVDGKFVGSGGLFNNQQNPSRPLVVADKPVGEWNTFHIKMVGDRVTIKLNDQLVVDNTPLENYWERGKPLPATGPIELQHHGNRLEFRNIFIKELRREQGQAAPANLVSLDLRQVKLSEAVRLIASSGDMSIILVDPLQKLAGLELPLVRFRDLPADKALEKVCRAAGVHCERDRTGVYYISESGVPL